MKPTYQDKIELLDGYMSLLKPPSHQLDTLIAIKTDVVRVGSKRVKTVPDAPVEGAERIVSEHSLYNRAMGVYRDFLKERGSYLDMTGRKASDNKKAMTEIIDFVRGFMRSNMMPAEDADVLEGIQFMFAHWDRLNDYLKGRIQLPQISINKQEIYFKIKNGADKKTAIKDDLKQYKQSLTGQ
jgi:uncharacterized protein YeeX (DUF496 family)